MSSILATSMVDSASAQTQNARFQAFSAELQGRSIGQAVAQQDASQRFTVLAGEAESSLRITSPQNAIVLTQNAGRLNGQHVGTGQPLLELAADGERAVRLYIPAAAFQRISTGAQVALELPGCFSPVRLTLAQPGGDAVELPQGLVASQSYQGVKLPVFYCARMVLPASGGSPKFGTAGRAKIFGARRSVAGRLFTIVADLVKAHFW